VIIRPLVLEGVEVLVVEGVDEDTFVGVMVRGVDGGCEQGSVGGRAEEGPEVVGDEGRCK